MKYIKIKFFSHLDKSKYKIKIEKLALNKFMYMI